MHEQVEISQEKNTHLSKLNTEKSLDHQIKCSWYNNFNMYLIKWLTANTQQNDHFHFSPKELMKPKNIKFQVQRIYVSTCKISVYAQCGNGVLQQQNPLKYILVI